MIQDGFMFKRIFHCFLDDSYTDNTCDKGKTEQKKLVMFYEVIDRSFVSRLIQTTKE